jgi:ABC-type transport system involved in multi-copper enzyme maturation permease subunit
MPGWAWGAIGGLVVAAVLAAAWLVRRRRRITEPTPWLGPLFWYELVRLTRRGAQPRLRGLYAVLLLVGMLVTYLSVFSGYDPVVLLFDLHPKLPIKQSAVFGRGFAAAYLYSQLVAVVLITPIYGGGAVTEEKDRRSLDYLQSSLLSNREIVLGKFAARMVFVAGVVIAGLPILALTRFFGGVDEFILFGGFVVTLMTLFSLGSFSLLLGVYKDSLREVLYWSYGVVVLFGAISVMWCIPGFAAVSPFSAIAFLFASGTQVLGGATFGRAGDLIVTLTLNVLFHGSVGVFCLVKASRRIRLVVTEEMTTRRKARKRPPVKAAKPVAVADLPADVVMFEAAPPVVPRPTAVPIPPHKRMDKVPPPALDVGDDRPPTTVITRRTFRVPLLGNRDPFFWKERNFTSRLPVLETGLVQSCSTLFVVTFVVVLAMVLFFGTAVKLSRGESFGDVVLGVVRTYLVVAGLVLAPVIGIRAAGAVVRERQRQTLLSLLTLPDARGPILNAKWLTPLHWVRYGLISLAAAAALGLCGGGIHPLGAVAGLTFLVGFIPFVNSLGLWLSLNSTTGTRAVTLLIITLMGLCLVPVFVAVLIEAFLPGVLSPLRVELLARTAYAVSPPVGLWGSFVGWDDFHVAERAGYAASQSPRHMPGGAEVIGGCVAGWTYLTAAAGLYWASRRKFEREGAG